VVHRFILATIAVLFFGALNAGAQPDPSVLRDEALKESLYRTLSRDHKRIIDYSSARELLISKLHAIQSRRGPVVVDVYCQHEFPIVGQQAGQAADGGTVNIEHTWPQSRFGGRDRGSQKSDLHHLFPCDKELNSRRGNMKFGDVEQAAQELKCRESRIGHGKGGPRFEPPDSHKGNVARALFYFAVRYGMRIDPDEEQALRSWHREDPVDDAEKRRNAEIAKLQGNRNPFIDNPVYVERIENF
jgi:deoxyribonuclease I